jgi:hypothetical protein
MARNNTSGIMGHLLMLPVLLALSFVLASATALVAQVIPTEPITAADGRVVVGAEITATVASDDPGFFNYTDYEYSALRNVRAGLTAEVRATRRLQFLGELRVDHGDHLQPFALYVRIRPWPERRFDVQAGRIPATFGAFGRGSYGTANLLIGTPLAYQYLTSLRPDALPAHADDLLNMRGRGWLSTFPRGVATPDRGLPIINTVRSDTGVQIHGVNGMFEWTGAVTTGSLSNPRVRDDNDGRQVAGRVVARPVASLALGASLARGAYVSSVVEDSVSELRAEDGTQRAVGIDAEFSAGRFLARGEIIHSEWRLPHALDGTPDRNLGARSVLVEARYRILPGVQIAGRAERLTFGRLQLAGIDEPWEAPVNRIELGGSYAIIRNVILKGSWQHNSRNGGRVREDGLLATQLVYWF